MVWDNKFDGKEIEMNTQERRGENDSKRGNHLQHRVYLKVLLLQRDMLY
jgi:hypothetical protein